MIYGSETWPVKAGDTDRMERNEMKMVRWICGVRLQDSRGAPDNLSGRIFQLSGIRPDSCLIRPDRPDNAS